MSFEDWISIVGALVAGLALGWLLHDWLQRRAAKRPQAAVRAAPRATTSNNGSLRRTKAHNLRRQVKNADLVLAGRQSEVERHQANLVRANAELALRDRELETLRNRLEKRDREHARLLQEVGERRARLTEAGADLYRLNQELIRREDDLGSSMKDVAERSHELEVLEQLDAAFQADMDELTQAIQQMQGELSRQRSVLDGKQIELNEAKALLVQRETELAEVIRLRERTERDIELVYEHLEILGGEHERLMARLDEAAAAADARAQRLNELRQENLIEAEPVPPELESGLPDDEGRQIHLPQLEPAADDLTRIKGIGPGYASLLKAAGITTFTQLSELSADQLRDMLAASRLANVEAWIAEARALAAEHELGRLMDAVQDVDLLIEGGSEGDEEDEDDEPDVGGYWLGDEEDGDDDDNDLWELEDAPGE